MCAAARPVVNGLAEQYAAEMDFFDLDGSSAQGRAKEREFGMIYHGYVVLDRWGGLYWHSVGHNFTAEALQQRIEEALAVTPPS